MILRILLAAVASGCSGTSQQAEPVSSVPQAASGDEIQVEIVRFDGLFELGYADPPLAPVYVYQVQFRDEDFGNYTMLLVSKELPTSWIGRSACLPRKQVALQWAGQGTVYFPDPVGSELSPRLCK